LGMPSRRTNIFPESGRGLGHVTPTIFGSTVGYPSDSLASCFIGFEKCQVTMHIDWFKSLYSKLTLITVTSYNTGIFTSDFIALNNCQFF